MANKFEDMYQEIPNGFVYLWRQMGWQEAATPNNHTTLMKRACELHESLSCRENDRVA